MILNSTISLIAAMDEKRGIGKNNNLLFRISADMKRMKELTTGHSLIMGRKTFESLGRLLPNRTHVVITGNPDNLKNLNYQPQYTAASIEEGIEKAKQCPGSDEVFIFGGARVYTEAIEKNLVDKLYLTVVSGSFDADAFFPSYNGFKQIKAETRRENGLTFSFIDLIRA